jgi:hypothetical protein
MPETQIKPHRTRGLPFADLHSIPTEQRFRSDLRLFVDRFRVCHPDATPAMLVQSLVDCGEAITRDETGEAKRDPAQSR